MGTDQEHALLAAGLLRKKEYQPQKWRWNLFRVRGVLLLGEKIPPMEEEANLLLLEIPVQEIVSGGVRHLQPQEKQQLPQKVQHQTAGVLQEVMAVLPRQAEGPREELQGADKSKLDIVQLFFNSFMSIIF